MRMLPSKMVPFSVTIAFLCGRAKTIKKRKVWTRKCLENGAKNSLFSNTCGQGLSFGQQLGRIV